MSQFKLLSKSIAMTTIALVVSTSAMAHDPKLHAKEDQMNCEKMKKHMDMLEFVSIKHSIMRLQDLPKCPNQKLKKAMIKKVFDFLDEKYPNWRTNKIFFEEQFGNRIGKNLIKYRMFWK